MASRSGDHYADQVEQFKEEWQPFRGLLTREERTHWDVLVDRAANRPYTGHCQRAADAKCPIVFSMLVTQQAEIARLRGQLDALEAERCGSS
jgi:hypothetical protein